MAALGVGGHGEAAVAIARGEDGDRLCGVHGCEARRGRGLLGEGAFLRGALRGGLARLGEEG